MLDVLLLSLRPDFFTINYTPDLFCAVSDTRDLRRSGTHSVYPSLPHSTLNTRRGLPSQLKKDDLAVLNAFDVPSYVPNT